MMRLARCCWYVLTLRCEEADRVRAVGRQGELTLSERLGAWLHTLLCVSCRRARRQLRLLQQLLRDAGDDAGGPALDPDTRRRIAARLARQAAGETDAD